jgi:hypothetical protein
MNKKHGCSCVHVAGLWATIFLLAALTVGAAKASTTETVTITAGSGTLTYTAVITTVTCVSGLGKTVDYSDISFSSFSYSVSGTTTQLAGSDFANTPAPACDIKGSLPPVTLTGVGVQVVFTPSDVAGKGTATVATGTPGFINPKYVVVGVTYAPPGPSSYVQYTDATTVGNTSTVSSSFSDDVGFSVSTTNQASIPSAEANSSGGVTLTYTQSTDFTTTESSSTTVTLSKTATLAYKTPGVPTADSPVDHDYDYIWLWLNPELLFSVFSTTPTQIQWNGYAYDPNDPSGTGGPDIYAVQVGCLNGDFSCPSADTILARSWATDVTWPAGQGPGLTSSDIANILLSDPLASSYSLLDGLPSTTSDGRFTRGAYPPNPINYTEGGLNTMYSLSTTDSESVAQGASYQVKQSFGLTEKLSGSFLGIWGETTTYKETDTLIWNYSWLNTLTTTTTITDALSITGPPDSPPYTGPGQFIYYQDNIFGTFLFYPSN